MAILAIAIDQQMLVLAGCLIICTLQYAEVGVDEDDLEGTTALGDLYLLNLNTIEEELSSGNGVS